MSRRRIAVQFCCALHSLLFPPYNQAVPAVKKSYRIGLSQAIFGGLQIAPPGGQRAADILAKFEEDETKRPLQARHLAIPIEVRRTERGIVSRAQQPRAFQCREIGKRIVGLNRTFLIPGVGIFQRREKRKVRLLYAFESTVPIPAALDFVGNAMRVIRGDVSTKV